MGCSSSAFDVAKRAPQFQKDMIQYQAMQLAEREIRKLFDEFRKVDVDGSGSIALSELLVYINLPITNFTRKVFSIFDDDQSGEIDFREFVLALWNYCTLTSVTLGKPFYIFLRIRTTVTVKPFGFHADMFAFDLYDADGSGEISPSEVTQMLSDIFGKHEMKTNQHAKAYD